MILHVIFCLFLPFLEETWLCCHCSNLLVHALKIVEKWYKEYIVGIIFVSVTGTCQVNTMLADNLLTSQDWERRREEDRLLIERILIIIRNILHVPPNVEKEMVR
jgi:hypothetical protein